MCDLPKIDQPSSLNQPSNSIALTEIFLSLATSSSKNDSTTYRVRGFELYYKMSYRIYVAQQSLKRVQYFGRRCVTFMYAFIFCRLIYGIRLFSAPTRCAHQFASIEFYSQHQFMFNDNNNTHTHTAAHHWDGTL